MLARRTLLVACTLGLWAAAAPALAQLPAVTPTVSTAPAELAAELPVSKLQGQGQLTFMTLRVYDARLWTGANGVGSDWNNSLLALELNYARSLRGTKIAERSLSEMQRQGDIDTTRAARWLSAMKQVFPDVKEGDRITGVNVPGVGARFYFNGKLVGDVRDADFARLFFGVWLSPKTSEPALREALLGKPS